MNHSDARIFQANLKAQFLKEHMREGEVYAGLVLGMDGEPDYHLFVPAGEFQGNWKDAIKWAKDQGYDLPNRREGRILFANAKAAFKEVWYSLSEQHEALPDSAWMQYFGSGNQNYYLKSNPHRARAVRRLFIQ